MTDRYLVALEMGQWLIAKGRTFLGPYPTRQAALDMAITLARLSGKDAEVMTVDTDGTFRIDWSNLSPSFVPVSRAA